MNKQLYIIEYESAHFCGGESHCVVWAVNADDAQLEAGLHMEESMRELFRDEYNDEFEDSEEYGLYDDESAYVINWCEPLTVQHPHWVYYTNPTQQDFYPVIGTPE